MVDYVTWKGASGKSYQTELLEIGTPLKANPGIYVFCKQGSAVGKWAQIYVGECESFQSRLYENLEQHHRWDCVKRNGATHVCVKFIGGGKQARIDAENDLRNNLDAPCNRQ